MGTIIGSVVGMLIGIGLIIGIGILTAHGKSSKVKTAIFILLGLAIFFAGMISLLIKITGQ